MTDTSVNDTEFSTPKLPASYASRRHSDMTSYQQARLAYRMRHLAAAAARQARSSVPEARPTRWNQLR